MKRRAFIAGLGGAAAAWPLVARGQPATPVIGFLRSTPSAALPKLPDLFRQGLSEVGFVEGGNVLVEYRYADNHLDRLPDLAAELVSRPVNVIVANSLAAEAARGLTKTIPIVFVTADDPVTRGLVASLSRPGANLTGLTFFGGLLGAKRVELLHQLAPKASVVGFLMDPKSAGAQTELPDAQRAASALGQKLIVAEAASAAEFEPAFEKFIRSDCQAVVVAGSPLFSSERRSLVALASRHAVPAIYDVREHVEAGGLISYGASLSDAYRHAGVYAGKILKGAKPSELPVLQPTKFEIVLNLRAAKAINIEVPPALLARADEVIE
jgi:putative ABC transport system substrate-binding protein